MSNREIKKVGEVLLIPREDIRPFPNQPRHYFDQTALKKLADSIRTHGQITPVHVKELGGNGKDPAHRKFELVDGQRRWHACEMVGKQMVRAIVDPIVDEEDQYTNSIIANFDREQHTPLEVAEAVGHFHKKGKKIAEIAEIFSRSEAWVNQQIKIGRLDRKVFEMMSPDRPEEFRLSFAAALYIVELKSPEMQLEAAKKVVSKKMTATRARAYIRLLASETGEIRIGGHKRSPHKDYEVFANFVTRIREDETMFLNMLPDYFSRMFCNRPKEHHKVLVQRLKSALGSLAKLIDKVEKAEP
jgi:ParB family transcriptional regulator, chromosome partitioning protein